jgi:asparagine synthase (glutamine-hydrolysing)
LFKRPKMGFGVPIGEWLRGPLRGWAEELLSSRALAEHGMFDESLLRHRWSEHQSGRRNWQHALWTVLQFQAWRQANP